VRCKCFRRPFAHCTAKEGRNSAHTQVHTSRQDLGCGGPSYQRARLSSVIVTRPVGLALSDCMLNTARTGRTGEVAAS